MIKADYYTKQILNKILAEGCLDKNPRLHYEDNYEDAIYDEKNRTIISKGGNIIKLQENQTVKQNKNITTIWTPAHTLSVNSEIECSYDISKGEFPIITLRPIATKASIAEIFWIYQKESNDLVVFDELLGKKTWDIDHKVNNWWNEWALRNDKYEYILNKEGHPHIGSTYGEVIRKYNLVRKRLKEMKENPDSRRHIINLWQDADYDLLHGLKPCAFMTFWNIRHGKDGVDYLDMILIQRSSDFATAGCINQVQYTVLLMLFARHLGIEPGIFTWKPINVQIYDRHIEQAKEMLSRESVECQPKIILNPNKTDFYDFTPDDIKIEDYPIQEIKKKNYQLKFPLGI